MSDTKKVYALPFKCFEAFNSAIFEKSDDRARVIVAACWIEEFLKVKLMNEFAKGNAKARKALFSNNGPFATFSAKINAAFCAGWIDSDVHHDIQVIRKLRNSFAHNYNSLSLNDEMFQKEIDSLKVPHRKFYDWGQLRVASTNDGLVISSGDNSSGIKDGESIPGLATFWMALPVVLEVLAANLDILFTTEEKGDVGKLNCHNTWK